jgi:hypothetical protein
MMRIFGVFRVRSVVLGSYLLGAAAFLSGCGEGEKSPTEAAADNKRIEADQQAARTKQFGPSGVGGTSRQANPAPSDSKPK